MNLAIDSRFQGLCPPLTNEETQLLRSSLILEGCRDPLIVWRGIVVDGHNRYALCKEESLPYETVEKDFKDREEAEKWILSNQLGRRNLQPGMRDQLLAKMYGLMRKSGGCRATISATPPKELCQSDTVTLEEADDAESGKETAIAPRSTAAVIAEQFNVSERTVSRAVSAAKDIEKLDPDVREAINSGIIKASKAEIKALRQMTEWGQREALAAAKASKKKKFDGLVTPLKPPNVKPKLPKTEPVATDALGVELPDGLQEAFGAAPALDALRRELSAWVKQVEAIAETSGGVELIRVMQQVTRDCQNVSRALRFATPYAICPYCSGEKTVGCPCDQRGWATQAQHESHPNVIRDKRVTRQAKKEVRGR